MTNIKALIKNWLFKEEIEKLNNIFQKQQKLENAIVEARENYNRAYNSLTDTKEVLARCLDVGVDYNARYGDSWAVISIKGKPDTVRFIVLESQTAREMHEFLKRFEQSNVIFDSPFSKEFFRI